MLILGIETSCDESSIAIVRDGREILSHHLSSQSAQHAQYGGVFPELSSREHLQALPLLLKKCFIESEVSPADLDAIAVTQGPGLIGSLLVGIDFAQGVALATGKPLVGINHLEAHLWAAIMCQKIPPPFPALGLILSGGHTALLRMEAFGEYTLLGTTVDDAIGEAFDKVAQHLGLSYPGGPAIEKIAQEGDPTRYSFKAGTPKANPLHFSFSGLKTSVRYTAEAESPLTKEKRADLAASFQEAAFRAILDRVHLVMAREEVSSILIGGGVAQNHYFRKKLAQESSLPLIWPSPTLCQDNGAMIAGLAGYQMAQQIASPSLGLQAYPRLRGDITEWMSHPSHKTTQVIERIS